MPLFSDNPSPSLLFEEHVDPSNPAAGFQRLFVDTDHILKLRDSAGTVTTFGAGFADPMTTRGDIIIRNAANATARLGIGSSGKVLSSDGTDISWQTPSSGGLTQAYAGYNTVGGSTETPGVNGKVYAKSITLANDCLITSIGAHILAAAGNEMGLSVALYTDSSGPSAVIGVGAPVAALMNMNTAGARWVECPLGVWVPAGTYWIAIRHSDSGGSVLTQIHYDGSGSDRTGTAGGANQWVDWSAMGSTATSSNRYSIRANTIR